ncbi:zinc-dependent alcohol dehydrogenase family protein [Micromonospora echinofusca]|uniref:Alcohol dehydrogenase catalytic domain-containing protein n=1 Tax=Micromonospora echinofusca TaxID=47858 RepID=A0ABS3VK39_MICEH|nr:zinc-dependent alcohol dehydrogenase family protein [Micromonospora echinofusca]MBO4204846.1 alcohol dehydrogenase catalytic domain-containing protein [Micromonospora echinofusca]
MRAVVYDTFGVLPEVREVPDPVAPAGGVVVAVRATGLCRSDWHGWRGHDADIRLPHVPGHEFAGEIAAVGAGVTGWQVGDRVTAPFVCACGTCPACLAGDHQVCHRQQQPGFTHWGSFADLVVVHHAGVNLVRLPDEVDFGTAAALGCRFATAFRAVVAQGRVRAGEWVAVYGCGGVGLSAVMIAAAVGARVVAVDVRPQALAMAARCGAAVTLDASTGTPDVAAVTGDGAHLSIDALGSQATLTASVRGLRRRGRHVQVGLLPATVTVPMDRVVAHELEVIGSHGMAAHAYPEMLALVQAGRLRPGDLVTEELSLSDAPAALATMDGPAPAGIRIVVPGTPPNR